MIGCINYVNTNVRRGIKVLSSTFLNPVHPSILDYSFYKWA